MSVEIQKNKPMPAGKSGKQKYPWTDLKVGDSFLVDMRQWASGSLAYFNKKMKRLKKKQIKIETRSEGDKCRVWRVK